MTAVAAPRLPSVLRTREQVRVLGPGDRDAFVALAEQDPVVNVFADYRARLTNLDERWLGGQVWGRFEGDELVAGCHLGANLVPVQCTPDDVGAFADVALRRRNTVGTIVGPQRRRRGAVGPGRGRAGPHRGRSGRASRTSRWTACRRWRRDPGVRLTTPADLDALYPACVAMYTEEVGVSPENDAGGGDLYRARIQQLIGRGWSMASFDDQGVVVQGRGRLRDAVRRPGAGRVGASRPPGRGARVGGMAAVVSHVLGSGMAPVVSLYVNEWNAAGACGVRAGWASSRPRPSRR